MRQSEQPISNRSQGSICARFNKILLQVYLTTRPAARKASPHGLTDPWSLKAKIVLVSPNWSDRKSNNKVSKFKLKKDLFGNKTRVFRYSMTRANSPVVA